MTTIKKLLLPLAVGALVTACGETNATDPKPASMTEPQPATAQADPESATAQMDAETLASLNGETISTQEFAIFFQERMQQRPGIQPTPQMQGAAFSDMINVYLLAQEAEKSGLAEMPNVKAGVEVQTKQFLARLTMADFANKYTPDDAEIEALYQEKVASAPAQEYKARHILLETEEDAGAVIVELDGGADFVELAKTRSTGPSGPNGGDLGWFAEGQMVKPFFDAVTGMEKGSYSKQPVQTQFGWHIILLEDVRAKEQPSLEDMKPALAQELKQKALRDYVAKLQSSADIQVNSQFAQAEKPAAQIEQPAAAAETPAAGEKTEQ